MKHMRFTVMNISGQYRTKYALTLIGFHIDNYIVPRYIRRGFDFEELQRRADSLNEKLSQRNRLMDPKRSYLFRS